MNKFNNLRLSTDADFARIAMPIRGFGDMPIGDGHSGPLCGNRDMPFGVVGALGVLGTAATVGVGVAGGVTALAVVGATITVVAAAAVVAGLAMTVVGAITGDKDLMKIGAIVGIAGGVAGIAAGAIGGGVATGGGVGASAAEVAVPAASSTATAGAQSGLLGGGASASAMSNAITPTFSAVGSEALGAGAGLAATSGQSALGTIGAVGSIGSSAYQAVSPSSASRGGSVAPSTYIPPDSLSTKGANAPSIPVTIGPGAPSVADVKATGNAGDGGYFSELMSDKNLAAMTGPALVGISTGVIKGMGADTTAAYYDAKGNQDQLNYKKEQDARAYANANTQGYNGMTTRPLTQEEYDQAKLNKARMANQTAGLLTQSA